MSKTVSSLLVLLNLICCSSFAFSGTVTAIVLGLVSTLSLTLLAFVCYTSRSSSSFSRYTYLSVRPFVMWGSVCVFSTILFVILRFVLSSFQYSLGYISLAIVQQLSAAVFSGLFLNWMVSTS
ncbi:hypothetical protein GEMRC1_002305 [Eukaryota sp. GEM-RC1]